MNVTITTSSATTNAGTDFSYGIGGAGIFFLVITPFLFMPILGVSGNRENWYTECRGEEWTWDYRRRSRWRAIAEKIHPTPLPRKISDCIYNLNILERKLERFSYIIQERDQALYGKMMLAIQRKSTELAEMYANECAETRKMAKAVIFGVAALEKASQRLDTLSSTLYREPDSGAGALIAITLVIKEAKARLENMLPQVSAGLSIMIEILEKSAHPRMHKEIQMDYRTQPSSEAKEMLEAAEKDSANEMKKRFQQHPEIPNSE